MSSTITTVDDSANDVGQYSSIAIGIDGLPAISYFDRTANSLKVAHCGNVSCTSGNTITTLNSPGTYVGGYTSARDRHRRLPCHQLRDFSNDALVSPSAARARASEASHGRPYRSLRIARANQLPYVCGALPLYRCGAIFKRRIRSSILTTTCRKRGGKS